MCVNDGAIVWLAISYAYKGLLQLVAVLMAFHTRNVRIKALNDSTEIAAIIYINSITLALLTVVEFALSNYHEVHAGMFGLALLVGATLFLSLVFVPRVCSHYGLVVLAIVLVYLYRCAILQLVHLYKDPKGETVLDPSPVNTSLSLTRKTTFKTDHDDEVAVLKRRLTEMEKKLSLVQVFAGNLVLIHEL